MITVDFREASASKSILDGLIKLGVKVEIGRLDAGDYAISSNETPALLERRRYSTSLETLQVEGSGSSWKSFQAYRISGRLF